MLRTCFPNKTENSALDLGGKSRFRWSANHQRSLYCLCLDIGAQASRQESRVCKRLAECAQGFELHFYWRERQKERGVRRRRKKRRRERRRGKKRGRRKRRRKKWWPKLKRKLQENLVSRICTGSFWETRADAPESRGLWDPTVLRGSWGQEASDVILTAAVFSYMIMISITPRGHTFLFAVCLFVVFMLTFSPNEN